MTDGSDAAILDCDLAREPWVACAIDNPGAANQDVIARSLGEQDRNGEAE
jgi:hypothetical protein